MSIQGRSDVEGCCQKFLNNYFGQQGQQPTVDAGERGLRLVCLGNAEKTVQGELVHFLRANAFNAVSECGVVGGEGLRSPDITVFAPDWQPRCVVELKHYSANQGSLSPLVKNLQADQAKHNLTFDATLPLLQIGLYTEICCVKPDIPEKEKEVLQHGLYRFLKTYYRGSRECDRRPKHTVDEFTELLVSPASSKIVVDEKYTVTGRVHHILRWAQA